MFVANFLYNIVEAATKAFYSGPWSQLGGYGRGRILYKLADLIEKNREELATLEGTTNYILQITTTTTDYNYN